MVGFIGPENIGKTFVLNKLCGFDLPSGTNIHTKGLSVKYSNNNYVICLDSAGMQTPVYYYKPKQMERFNINKEDLKKNEEMKLEMLNDRTITDIFIQDFILEVSEVLIIVVGQLCQNDQKMIERIANKYQYKKRIIIIHNFYNLSMKKDIEKKIEKDIILAFDTTERFIPDSNVKEYIEKNIDKKKQNISHLILAQENSEAGKIYNEKTISYLQDMIDTLNDKREFRLIDELNYYIKENYRKYFQFKKIPKEIVCLEYDKAKEILKIKSDENYEISNPIFNSLGNLISNPPFEVFVKNDRYICLLEISDLEKESLKIKIEKKKTEFNCLIIQGIKKASQYSLEENEKIIGMRNSGNFLYMIPLGPNYISVKLCEEKDFKYKSGILVVEVYIKEDVEENLN